MIVGAGLSGLACATFLVREGFRPLLLEAADAPGGRVRTDHQDGFLLDRGFQVLLPSYPTASELFDYERLELRPFQPGALVRVEGAFARVGDPRRRPSLLGSTLGAPVGGLGDKLRILGLERHLRSFAGRAGGSSIEALRAAGFSERMIERFFRPFLGGVFLERELATDAGFLAFVWSMFAASQASLPAAGMQALPSQLAEALPAGTLETGVEVVAVEPQRVHLRDGRSLRARAVVVATDGSTARRMLGEERAPLAWNGVTCLYFDAPEAPVAGAWLMLDGEGRGILNNVCFPSQVAPSYAPAGRDLASVSVLGDTRAIDLASVREELERWFGAPVRAWRHLATYSIPHALPASGSRSGSAALRGPFVCGDHTESPSIEGALRSGRRAAEDVAALLGAGERR